MITWALSALAAWAFGIGLLLVATYLGPVMAGLALVLSCALFAALYRYDAI